MFEVGWTAPSAKEEPPRLAAESVLMGPQPFQPLSHSDATLGSQIFLDISIYISSMKGFVFS